MEKNITGIRGDLSSRRSRHPTLRHAKLIMSEPAELEIALRRSRDYGYDVELRFTDPAQLADTRTLGVAALTDEALAAVAAIDPLTDEYGLALFDALFATPELRAAFQSAVTISEASKVPLRIRLVIDAASPELHLVRWEALRETETRTLLFTGDRIFFSRFISTPVYRSMGRRPREDLKALGIIASPLDEWRVGGRKLARIDANDEEARLRAGLNGVELDVLRSNPPARWVGPQALSEHLVAKRYDILYLVCHGMIRDREPILLLEGNGGESLEVSADDFVERVAELTNRPNLVVLASCQSAGQGNAATTEDGGVLAALGPRLAAAGVPAVIAMQGNVTIGTVQEFMRAFFTALATDGLIDRAVSLARGTIRERLDAWVPVLFMRLKSGGLWNDVGFIDGDVFQQWPELMSAVKAGGCTPLLGPGLVEAILGSRRELALALADEWDVPLAPADRDDLPQVAQYLAIRRSRTFLERAILQYAGKRIQSRYSEGLPEECNVLLDEVSDRDLRIQVAALVRHAWTSRARSLGPDPYRVLAELPFPLYLSTNFDPLLETALRTQELKGESREPVRAICKWNSRMSPGTAQVTDDPQYRPTAKAPLVFHMLGHIEIERSMVLTQDDYFDALIAATSREQLPQLIRTALTDRALLFLGFQIDDWSFRVLFRFLMNLEGADMLRDYPHVAVQIDPEEQRFRTPRDARKYLTEYFGAAGAARVSIYWGSTEDFIRELLVKFRQRYG